MNRPFLSCFKPVFQSKATCDAIDMKTIFYSHANETRFQKEGFALSLVLKVRVFGTQKWPVSFNLYHHMIRV